MSLPQGFCPKDQAEDKRDNAANAPLLNSLNHLHAPQGVVASSPADRNGFCILAVKCVRIGFRDPKVSANITIHSSLLRHVL